MACLTWLVFPLLNHVNKKKDKWNEKSASTMFLLQYHVQADKLINLCKLVLQPSHTVKTQEVLILKKLLATMNLLLIHCMKMMVALCLTEQVQAVHTSSMSTQHGWGSLEPAKGTGRLKSQPFQRY
jgi:hypothetical protein